VREQARKEGEVIIGTEGGWSVPQGILCMLLGVVSIYGVLLGTGYWIYGSIIPAAILTVVAAGAAVGLFMAWKKLKRIRAANNDTTNINEPAM
jgi:membrane-bound ClpP family serine protease